MVLFCRETGKSLSITLHVQPRARKTEFVAVHGDSLKIKVAAPPVDGAANEEIVRYIAGLLGVAKGAVRLKQGASGRRKVVEVDGATASDLTAALLRLGLLTIKLG